MSLKIKNQNYHNLPSEYTELDYIESSGTQYFNTGVSIDETNTVLLEVKCVKATESLSGGNRLLMGISSTNGIPNNLGYAYNANYWVYNTSYSALDMSTVTATWKYGERPSGTINGNSIYWSGDASATISATGSINFLAGNGNTYSGIYKVYYCEMYVDEVLVRNFIPAKNSSDEIGMYDTVSQTFFTSATSTAFIAGPETSLTKEIHELYKTNSESHNLPSGYTELEYIENSTIGSWFDTGVATITEKTVVEIKGYVNNGNSWFGGAGGAVPYFNTTSVTSGGNVPFRYGSSGTYSVSVTAGQLYSTPATLKFGNNKMYVNGELKRTLTEAAFTYDTYSLKIWSRLNGNTDQAIGRIYFANVYSEDTLQFQGIPAKRDSDSAIGLYDLVSDSFIASSGSGTFTAGPEVSKVEYVSELYRNNTSLHNLPSEYTEVEYVEAPSETYNLTFPFNLLDGLSVSTKVKFKSSSSRCLFGYSGSAPAFYWGKNSSDIIEYGAAGTGYDALTEHVIDYNVDLDNSKTYFYVDGVLYSSKSGTFSSYTYIMPISGSLKGNGFYLYYMTVKDSSDQTVYNYIPATRNSDGVVGLYETVNNVFLTPATGTLTAGSEVPKVTKIFDAGYDTTVTGNPLTMSNSRPKSISYKISGNVKRTIDIDGTTYNVPDGYTLLDYLLSSGTQYIDTNISGKSGLRYVTDLSIVDTYSGYFGIFGAVATSTTGAGGTGMQGQGTTLQAPIDASRLNLNTITTGTKYHIDATINAGTESTIIVDGTTYTTTAGSSITDGSLYLFGLNYVAQGTAFINNDYRFYNWLVYDGTTLSGAFYPAKYSDGTLGMYDFVTNTFFTNAGSGTFTAGNELPLPTNMLGVKGVGDKTENLFNKFTITKGYLLYASSGELKTNNKGSISDYIEVLPSTSYTLSGSEVTGWTQVYGICFYNSNKTFISGIVETGGTQTITTPSTTKYVRLSCCDDGSGTKYQRPEDTQFVKGSTAPSSYIPYGYKFPLLHAQNCGMVDMGELTWNMSETGKFYVSNSSLWANSGGCYCSKYEYSSTSWTENHINIAASGVLTIVDYDYTTKESFKESLSGVYLYYQRTTDSSWTTPTTYTIYDDSQLYKVGDYVDTIGSDEVRTNNVGIRILDGTESWNMANSVFYWTDTDMPYSQTVSFIPYCTHFKGVSKVSGTSQVTQDLTTAFYYSTEYNEFYIRYNTCTTADEFKAYLAAQYAAGTPVTIFYLLGTATTETITTPSITNVSGVNYLQSTSTIPVSELSATYRKKTNQ